MAPQEMRYPASLLHPAFQKGGELGETNKHRRTDIPRDIGWLLLTAGVVGEIAPGVIGTPFWIMGGLILWPRMGKRVESWMETHSPKLFGRGMRQVARFLDDLERRYPTGTGGKNLS